MTIILTCILAALILSVLLVATITRRFVVVDGREALLYRGGRFVRVLTAGTHWVVGWKIGTVELDVREATLNVIGPSNATNSQTFAGTSFNQGASAFTINNSAT